MTDTMLLKPEEAASLLRVGRTKLFQLVWSGELPVVRIGRSVRLPRAELERWIEARTVQPMAGERQ
jgi:excisionase family DNA binding protein